MKRTLLALAIGVAVCLGASKLSADQPTTSKTSAPDWRYRWHEGQWWYWTTQNSWLVWNGSAWVPYAQSSQCAGVYQASQPRSYSTAYGNYEVQGAAAAPQPAYSGERTYAPAYSAGSGGNYSGYGWNWGPGTAFRDAPGRRF